MSIATANPPLVRKPPPAFPIPPLREGDRLDSTEFDRRYQAMPEGIRAELLDGVVHMAAATRWGVHGRPAALLASWLTHYADVTPGVEFAGDVTVRLGGANRPEPDLAMRLPPAVGGMSHVDAEDFLAGPPELAVEIAAATVAIDLGVKLAVYQAAGVAEYLVWRTPTREVLWHFLEGGRYVRQPVGADGMLRSRVFPGLWLPVAALLAGRRKALRQAIGQGTATPEHAALVARLAAAGFADGEEEP